jgi:hypothetical protein
MTQYDSTTATTTTALPIKLATDLCRDQELAYDVRVRLLEEVDEKSTRDRFGTLHGGGGTTSALEEEFFSERRQHARIDRNDGLGGLENALFTLGAPWAAARIHRGLAPPSDFVYRGEYGGGGETGAAATQETQKSRRQMQKRLQQQQQQQQQQQRRSKMLATDTALLHEAPQDHEELRRRSQNTW